MYCRFLYFLPKFVLIYKQGVYASQVNITSFEVIFIGTEHRFSGCFLSTDVLLSPLNCDHCGIRGITASDLTKSREATPFNKNYRCGRQKQFAMLVARLSDMLWLLRCLCWFLVLLTVGGNGNGKRQTVKEVQVWKRVEDQVWKI